MADDSVPPKGRFARFRKLASLSAHLGSDVLSKGVKRLTGGDDELVSLSTAEKLVATLGDLKGMAMKLGQAVSMDAELLTPEVRAVLARLQNQAPPMSYGTVQQVVKEELGASPEELYASFEQTPMAAASLGQVHRAILHGGQEVAVKVQYPGIREALHADLDNLGALVGTLSRTSRMLDGRAYYKELRDQMTMEVDYRREAELACAFAEAARPLQELKVPEVFADRTTSKVLTLELIPGKVLKDFLAEEPGPEERFRVSRLLIRSIYGPFLLAGQMHADPHPGNFMVMPDGRLGVLDFGSIKRFSPNFVEVNRRLFLQAVDGMATDVVEVARAVGVSIELPEEEARQLLAGLLQIAGRPLRSENYDYAQDSTFWDTKRYAKDHALRLLKLRPPAEAVMFFRATGGLQQNLRLIGARGDFRSIYRELGAFTSRHAGAEQPR